MSISKDGPYAIPTCFSPADSRIPHARGPVPFTDSQNNDLLMCIAEAQRSANDLKERLNQSIVSPLQLGHASLPLRRTLSQALHISSPTLQRLASSTTYETTKMAVKTVLGDEESAAKRLVDFCVYDRFFYTHRLTSMSMHEYAAQVIATCAAVLYDLPHTFLDLAEVSAMVGAMERMFEYLHGNLPKDNGASGETPIVGAQTYPVEDCDKAWMEATSETVAWTETVSDYRWVVGHHFFNVVAQFCGGFLLRADQAANDNHAILCADHLRDAERFLRASTAGLWYAGAFPAAIYERHTRPAMISTDAREGFTGAHNADYERMKVAKSAMTTAIIERYGPDGNPCPRQLFDALKDFLGTEIADVEAHILVAEIKVKAGKSLAQQVKHKQIGLPQGVTAKGATDILRDMAQSTRSRAQRLLAMLRVEEE